MRWRVVLSRKAVKDAERLARADLKEQAKRLLQLLQQDPFASPPRVEKLVGNLAGYYSRRINIHHRLVYRVDREEEVVHVLRMWTHCE